MTVAICVLTALLTASILMNLALNDALTKKRDGEKEILDYLKDVVKALREERGGR